MRRKYPNIILSSELLPKEIIKIINHTQKIEDVHIAMWVKTRLKRSFFAASFSCSKISFCGEKLRRIDWIPANAVYFFATSLK